MELVVSGFAKVEDGRFVLMPNADQVETERLKTVVEKNTKAGKPNKTPVAGYRVLPKECR